MIVKNSVPLRFFTLPAFKKPYGQFAKKLIFYLFIYLFISDPKASIYAHTRKKKKKKKKKYQP